MGVVAEEDVSVKCGNAKDQGVPLPNGWQVAFRALVLPQIAERSAVKANAEQGSHRLQCKVLGIALPLPEFPSAIEEEQVGSLRVFSNPGGSRRVVVLCAYVQGTEWLYFEIDSNVADTIDVNHVVLGDMQCATLSNLAEDELDMMLNLIQHKTDTFSRLFAEAAWRAEEHRASSRGVPFDADLASVRYEANPFLWPGGNTSQVCVAWARPCSPPRSAVAADEMVPSKFSWHRLDNALSKGWSFPSPRFNAVLPMEAAELRMMLDDHAKWTSTTWLWPCRYLGYLVRGNAATGTFEPDPAKWPLDALQAAGGDMWKIIVWWEWEHVTVGPERKPHRVSMRVGDAIRGRKAEKTCLAPQVNTVRCFGFSGPQGVYELTGLELLQSVRDMQICGPATYSAAADLLQVLQDSSRHCNEEAYGDTQEKREVMKAHLLDVVAELDAISSMEVVDALIFDAAELFRRIPLGHELGFVVKARELLRKFLSATTSDDSKLRDCYAAVDAALDIFQRTWTANPATATDEIVRAMNHINNGVSQVSYKQARSPDPSTSCCPLFAVGTVVIFQNLIKRLDLEEQVGTVESYDVGTMRYAVRIHCTGARVRVLERCLRNVQAVVPVLEMMD